MSLRRNALLSILACALLAIIGRWSGNALLAATWGVPGVLLLLGLAHESRSVARAGLVIELDSPPTLHLGRDAIVRYRCRHSAPRTLEVELAPSAPDSFDVDASPAALAVPDGGSAALERTVQPTRLGVFVWPAARARCGGPLGLAWWPRRLMAGGKSRVVPDLLREPRAVRGLGARGERLGVRPGSGSEVMRLRDYRVGDAPRVVDWKATARAGHLVSRDFAEDHQLQIVLAVDAGRSSALRSGALDRFGHYANIAARLAQHAVAQDNLVGLVVYAERPLKVLPPARGIESAGRVRAALADSRATRGESNPVLAALRIRALARHRSLIVLLTDIDDATAASQLVQAVRLLLPKHLPFVAALSSAAAEALAAAPARNWLDPYRTLAAQEYARGLERKARALNAWGAPTLVARPERLEPAVFSAYEGFRRRRRA